MLTKNILVSFDDIHYLLLNVIQVMKDGWYYIKSPKDQKTYWFKPYETWDNLGDLEPEGTHETTRVFYKFV